MSAKFKGGQFLNRYLIKAVLTAQTPFHIGTGEKESRSGLAEKNGKPLDVEVSLVAADDSGKAYIPGSSLRGAIRTWIMDNFSDMSVQLEQKLKKKKRDRPWIAGANLLDFLHSNASLLEKIFGTNLNEGKLEVWDGYCTTTITDTTRYPSVGWNRDRLTYVAKSVAINPETGTAEDGMLFNYELVPTGARFSVNFSAQNLTNTEAALLLKVLEGFNHPDNPITLGAMGKHGFGQFKIGGYQMYRLENKDIPAWQELCAKDDLAGYDSIARKEFAFDKNVLKSDALPDAKAVIKHIEKLTLKLETPMVVRSGSHFIWKNSSHSKARNYRMEFDWGRSEKKHNSRDEQQVTDLYHSLKIEDGKVIPYYHVPSSSVRGALRQWTIQYLLDEKDWTINNSVKALKKDDLQNLPPNIVKLKKLLDLFGYAIEGVAKEVSHTFTSATRLKIVVDPFCSNCIRPDIDGEWRTGPQNNYGPGNVARHVKNRNPLDRIRHGSKKGGLHTLQEFAQGEKLTVRLEISGPTKFDKKLIEIWKSEIDLGIIRIGGLTGIGRGRVSIEKSEVRHGEK